MLKRIPCDHSQSEDEQLLYKFVKLLHLLDIPVTAETVQGCGSYKERATFLHSLVQLVTATQELLQPSSAPTHSLSPQASPTTAHRGSSGSQPHAHQHANEGQAQAPLAREAPRAGARVRACRGADAGVGAVPAGTCHAGPAASDVSHPPGSGAGSVTPVFRSTALACAWMLARHARPHVSTNAQQWADWAQQVQQRHLPALRQQQKVLESQVNLLDDEEWAKQHRQSVSALTEFLSSSHSFHHTYQQELRVWCQGQEPAQTFGLGRQASELLHRYSQVSTLLQGLSQLRKAHDTLHRCAAPLEGLQPVGLQRLLQAGQQELQRLKSMVDVLEGSHRRHEQERSQPRLVI
ncbi:MAG: hypothetical protein WDW38_010593 [Sanguina aurantia]